jgi:hypothetical protein
LDDRAILIAYLNLAWKNTCETQISYQGTKFNFATELLKQRGTCGGYDGSSGWLPSVFGNVRDGHGSFVSMHERVFFREFSVAKCWN